MVDQRQAVGYGFVGWRSAVHLDGGAHPAQHGLVVCAQELEPLLDRRANSPALEEISGDGSELDMERVDGLTMLEVLSQQPWTL